jgi:hypothetical protein
MRNIEGGSVVRWLGGWKGLCPSWQFRGGIFE